MCMDNSGPARYCISIFTQLFVRYEPFADMITPRHKVPPGPTASLKDAVKHLLIVVGGVEPTWGQMGEQNSGEKNALTLVVGSPGLDQQNKVSFLITAPKFKIWFGASIGMQCLVRGGAYIRLHSLIRMKCKQLTMWLVLAFSYFGPSLDTIMVANLQGYYKSILYTPAFSLDPYINWTPAKHSSTGSVWLLNGIAQFYQPRYH